MEFMELANHPSVYRFIQNICIYAVSDKEVKVGKW